MCESTNHILAVQPHGFISEGGRMAESSKYRIQTACQLILQGEIPPRIIAVWPQGYQKKNPRKRPHLAAKTLGEEMVAYCMYQPEMVNAQHIVVPHSWTTLGDIVATRDLIQQRGCSKVHVHFVTDKAHIRRVAFVWKRVAPPGWVASFYASPCSRLTWFERWVHEPVGIVWYWLKLNLL